MSKLHHFRIPISLTGIALALLLQVGVSHPAFSQEVHRFDIDTTDAAAAIHLFGAQSGVQILASAEVLDGKHLNKLSGEHSTDEGFKQLLAGSGLEHRYVGERAVALVSETSGTRSDVHMPQSAQQALDDTEARASETTANAEPAQNSAQSGTSTTSPQGQETSRAAGERSDSSTLEEVLVTGTHIRGVRNSAAPVTVLDREYIESTGISTTSGLIESIPQNFALTSQSGVLVPGTSFSTIQGSAINLRGIGEGTTLTLVNGRRMALGFLGAAADISALPLSAIERVEVLTDGASAIYGSDAVGGVVNFVLRKDFEGAETRFRAGRADGDVDEMRASQSFGEAWESGSALVSLEYYKRDLLPADERGFVPDTSDIGSLSPRDKNVSALFSGNQRVAEAVSIFADALYTERDSYNEGGRVLFDESFTLDNPQLFATLGLTWDVGGDWQIETSTSYAENELETQSNSEFGGIRVETQFASVDVQVLADGTLASLPGGALRLATGASWRSESYQEGSVFDGGFLGIARDTDQTVSSLFAELYLPIVGAENARAGVRRLELSIAGRYDEYSDVDSSLDPKFGLMWEPVDGLRVRGTYGTSYVAPRLFDYSLSGEVAFTITDVDPDAPGGFSRQLQAFGTDVSSLTPQESESFSFGVEISPPSIERLQLGLNYYQIEYDGRIAAPPFPSVMLGNPASFSTLVIRDPSVQQVLDFLAIAEQGQGFFDCDLGCVPDPNFDPASVDVIVDGRRRNLSFTKTSGLDVSIQYALSLMGGELQLGMDGTHILELEQQVTAESLPFETLDTYNNPPDWRLRGSVGYQRQGWTTNVFANYTDSYTDNRAVAPIPVESYTTVDFRIGYDFEARFRGGFASGLTVSASVQNLFDTDPPRTAILNPDSDMGFDPTNANPMGRLVAIELQKAW